MRLKQERARLEARLEAQLEEERAALLEKKRKVGKQSQWCCVRARVLLCRGRVWMCGMEGVCW